jgi:hypothetical protein
MEAAKVQNWAVEPQEEKNRFSVPDHIGNRKVLETIYVDSRIKLHIFLLRVHSILENPVKIQRVMISFVFYPSPRLFLFFIPFIRIMGLRDEYNGSWTG